MKSAAASQEIHFPAVVTDILKQLGIFQKLQTLCQSDLFKKYLHEICWIIRARLSACCRCVKLVLINLRVKFYRFTVRKA